ncbi:MAG: sialate O-acetylesterase [Planctomycetota bacterium]
MSGIQPEFIAMSFLWQFAVICALAQSAHVLRGELQLPAILSDEMVAQSNSEIAIWGKAAAGESVSVSLAATQVVGTVDEAGYWKVILTTPRPGGTHTLVVEANERRVINNVQAGQVWLGSGQSNMA